MPEFRKAAEKGMETLAPEVRTAIEKRFGDVKAITDDIAKRMGQKMTFPNALLDAVRERDPALAKEIEQAMAPAKAPAPEEKEVGKTVSAVAGTAAGSPVTKITGAIEVSSGEARVSAEAGYTATEGGATYAFEVEGSMQVGDATVFVGGYRDPYTVGVAGAGYAGVEVQVSESFAVGASAEVGVAPEGEGYAAAIPYARYEEGGVSFQISPMVTYAEGETPVGLDIKARGKVVGPLAVTARFYQYDLASPEVTATLGPAVEF